MGIMDEQEIIRNFRKGIEEGLKSEMKSETLRRADEIIHGERQDQYGDPEYSFMIIASYWSAYILSRPKCLGEELFAADVAIMLTLLKIARMSGQKWHPDNAIDACGYLAILNDQIKEEG